MEILSVSLNAPNAIQIQTTPATPPATASARWGAGVKSKYGGGALFPAGGGVGVGQEVAEGLCPPRRPDSCTDNIARMNMNYH